MKRRTIKKDLEFQSLWNGATSVQEVAQAWGVSDAAVKSKASHMRKTYGAQLKSMRSIDVRDIVIRNSNPIPGKRMSVQQLLRAARKLGVSEKQLMTAARTEAQERYRMSRKDIKRFELLVNSYGHVAAYKLKGFGQGVLSFVSPAQLEPWPFAKRGVKNHLTGRVLKVELERGYRKPEGIKLEAVGVQTNGD